MDCELLQQHPDYRRLHSIAGIEVDLRYTGPDNFIGRSLYVGLDCDWLHREAADALERAAGWLASHHPGYRIVVLDALRPHRIQQQMWQYLAGKAEQSYVADPARGSIHSFGMAVDVSLLDTEGRELDMGSGFDEFSELSHPALESALLAGGRLGERQLGHRRILRAAMQHGGFQGIPNEWWHFNAGDPATIRQHYVRID